MIVLFVTFHKLFVSLEDVFVIGLLRLLTIEEHPGEERLVFECFLEEGDKAIVLDENDNPSAFLCLLHHLHNCLKTNFFDKLKTVFVV